VQGDYAAVYQQHRHRVLAEREERLYASGFVACNWRDVDLTDGVGPGWRRVVLELHRQLLELDPQCRLYEITQKDGLLRVRGGFARDPRANCRARIARAVARATHTCEVCGDISQLREERAIIRSLCNACWSADRALAAERGERFANLTLAQLLSGDPRYPEPDDIVAFLDSERY
jgi:hypothetical protein